MQYELRSHRQSFFFLSFFGGFLFLIRCTEIVYTFRLNCGKLVLKHRYYNNTVKLCAFTVVVRKMCKIVVFALLWKYLQKRERKYVKRHAKLLIKLHEQVLGENN